jgi:cyclopropane fatty-acyl-phospholipid synthase-like methyltransferase
MVDDVPSPIDLRSRADALAWEAAASERPGRAQMLDAFVAEIIRTKPSTILELGSGPGFLAERILNAGTVVAYAALDFSAAMHDLARARLGSRAQHVTWIERDFRAADWSSGLSKVSAIVTLQAVHELRHKSRATRFHAEVRALLTHGGSYLMCDHWCGDGGMTNADLYMSLDEHSAALSGAAFGTVELLALAGTLALFKATP